MNLTIGPKLSSVVSLAVLLGACSSPAHRASEKYYLVATNIKVPYWQAAGEGLVAAAEPLKVSAQLVGPDTYDPVEQRRAFQRAVAEQPAGILVSAGDPALLKPDIDAAIAKGIPVITVDSDSPDSKRLTFVGTNNYQAGILGGRFAAAKLNGKGSVLVLTIPTQTNLAERLKGYRDAFAEHPGIKIAEVVDMKGDSRLAFDAANEVIDKKKPIDAIVCLEAISGKEVGEVLSRHKDNPKLVIAMDTDAGTLQWIDSGVIAATLAQKPYTMAFYGLRLLDELHHNKLATLDRHWAQDPKSPLPVFIDTGVTLIEKANLSSLQSP